MGLTAVLDGKKVLSFEIDPLEWKNLKGKNNPGFTMPECNLPALAAGGNGTTRIQFFRHKSVTDCNYDHPSESEEHMRLKFEIHEMFVSMGWKSDVEHRGPDGRWIADILVERPTDGLRIAIEVQLSPQTFETFEYRTQRYHDDGIQTIWMVKNPRQISELFPVINYLILDETYLSDLLEDAKSIDAKSLSPSEQREQKSERESLDRQKEIQKEVRIKLEKERKKKRDEDELNMSLDSLKMLSEPLNIPSPVVAQNLNTDIYVSLVSCPLCSYKFIVYESPWAKINGYSYTFNWKVRKFHDFVISSILELIESKYRVPLKKYNSKGGSSSCPSCLFDLPPNLYDIIPNKSWSKAISIEPVRSQPTINLEHVSPAKVEPPKFTLTSGYQRLHYMGVDFDSIHVDYGLETCKSCGEDNYNVYFHKPELLMSKKSPEIHSFFNEFIDKFGPTIIGIENESLSVNGKCHGCGTSVKKNMGQSEEFDMTRFRMF